VNFYEHQDKARSTTRRLIALFALAVASLIVMAVLLVAILFTLGSASEGVDIPTRLWSDPPLLLGVAVLVLGVVLLGTGFRTAQLRGGGKVVAESLGGRLLNVQTRDADERKILNVVEEMAIASGLPVPPVYLLEESAINAFAAGFRKEDAVIGITRGCIQQLDREELQGVIAHEFSHVFNGDMRLNIRLIGWLYGIMVLGMIGYFMLRSNRYGMVSRSRNNKGAGGLLALGLGLMVIGYGGTFFGNLIKAAVSRQREFLADASAVQFTRNPDGIGGALRKIAASQEGSLLENPDAAEVSHMLFGQGIKAGFSGLFATHPPLEERIKRIQPRPGLRTDRPRSFDITTDAATQATRPTGAAAVMTGIAVAERIVAAVGEPSQASLQMAVEQLAALPPKLKEEAHSSLGASLLVFALLILPSLPAIRKKQLALLQARLQPATLQSLHGIVQELHELPRELHTVLMELAIPSLKQLSTSQAKVFLALVQELVLADGQKGLYEWCLQKSVQQQLAPPAAEAFRQLDLENCHAACSILLNALAHTGQETASERKAAFLAGADALGIKQAIAWREDPVSSDELDEAMATLVTLKPLQKPRLLKAMVASILHDGKLLPDEVELLRVVGALLDCPLPPLSAS